MPLPLNPLMKFALRSAPLCCGLLFLTGCAEQQPLLTLSGAPDGDALLLVANPDAQEREKKISTSTGRFLDLVKQPGRVVLVQFWGPYCPPCRQLSPELNRLLKAHPTNLAIVKVNTQDRAGQSAELQRYFGVYGIPHMCVFVDDKLFTVMRGYMNVERLESRMEDAFAQIAATPVSAKL